MPSPEIATTATIDRSSDVGPTEDEPVETFSAVVDLNPTPVFALSQTAARPMLAAGWSSTITIASEFGPNGAGQVPQASHSAGRGAVVNPTRELVARWARRGVRVNAIAPAFFSTEMATALSDEGATRWMRRKTPMGRAGELHGALVHRASDASSYVTATTLHVDGGRTAVREENPCTSRSITTAAAGSACARPRRRRGERVDRGPRPTS